MTIVLAEILLRWIMHRKTCVLGIIKRPVPVGDEAQSQMSSEGSFLDLSRPSAN